MKKSPEIIAEAGSNHNGNPELAKLLVDQAVQAKATSIKFQFIFAEGLYLPELFDGIEYSSNPVYDKRKTEEMSFSDWQEIWGYAKEKRAIVSASVFCKQGIDMLYELGAPYVKIASTDLTNHSLIGKACSKFQRVIVSTGMASLAEVDDMVNFVRLNYPETDLNLMHCVSAYPCKLSEANTKRVALLRQAFNLPIGYSDHTAGNISAAMALVQGANFFEKHFTTDRSLPGFDHVHALEGIELSEYVSSLNEAAESMNKPTNTLSPQEVITKLRARRAVYAARNLPAGHVLKESDLLFVRPSSIYSCYDLSEFIGKKLEQDTPRYAALGYGETVGIVESNGAQAKAYWGNEMVEKHMLDKDYYK